MNDHAVAQLKRPAPRDRLALPLWSLFGWSLLAALLFVLAWPPIGWWWCAFLAPAPLAWCAVRAPSARRAALAVFLGQIPAWIVLEWWIRELTAAGFLALCLYCSAYAALVAALLHRVARSRRFGGWPMALLLPVVWAGVEFLRGTVVLGGYAWFQLGIALPGPPTSSAVVAQSASLFGTLWLSALAASVAGALVDLRRVRDGFPRRRAVVAVVVVALLQAANVAYGLWIVRSTATRPGPHILALQTNLSVSNKNAWSAHDQIRDVTGFAVDTVNAADDELLSGHAVDLVVWPETMVPGLGLEPDALRTLEAGNFAPGRYFLDLLLDVRGRVNAPLLVGAGSYLGLRSSESGKEWRWDRHYNSAYWIDGEMPFRRYDKLVLTPFGEEMPLISRWEWLEAKLVAWGAPGLRFDLDAGDAPVRFEIAYPSGPGGPRDRVARIATPICFEDTVASLCRRLVYENGERAADLLVNLSNDGWFGTSHGGREQHVLHARICSIETATPMLRCVNTGLSVLIDDRGRVTDWIGAATSTGAGAPAPGDSTIRGALAATTHLTDRVTLASRVGDLWPWTALIATALLTLLGAPARTIPFATSPEANDEKGRSS
jgi:apolipoprotein N-acyltransferase